MNAEPVCIKDLEEIASRVMPSGMWDYYDSGANGQQTKAENESAFGHYRLHPRMLRDVSAISTETTVLGQRVKTPLGVSPCAMHRLAHDDGEAATSRAASRSGSIMILSTFSTVSLEDVIAQGSGRGTQYWMQLYVYRDRSVTESIVRRAERAGYKALVVTVDAPVLGRRLADARRKFGPPPHVQLANFFTPQRSTAGVYLDPDGEFSKTFGANLDRALTWTNGIDWLRSITSLPIVVKGVLTAEDTRLAIEHGCAGVMVSNHGGRQLDGTLATIDALPQVVEAAGDQIEVYMDGGVRRGTDIFKALALGARAVFVARPVLWGLVYKGEDGAYLALGLLQKELETAMMLAGAPSIADIDESYVYRPARRWVRLEPAKGGSARRIAAKL
ncbi:Hydroxyacid oxidase 1 [Coemansia javaensis]|uniref:Oxidase FUB9 n=1 Tax=Coemansia javaensis TaxID=2761396 RepID=A0A9W8HKG4_9FUNG|nr:Hydroxyacid oxidase 1 [Coemansia javaensis]